MVVAAAYHLNEPCIQRVMTLLQAKVLLHDARDAEFDSGQLFVNLYLFNERDFLLSLRYCYLLTY